MLRRWIVCGVVFCVGCGRLAFEPTRDDGGTSDDQSTTTDTPTDADPLDAWSQRIKLTFNNPGPAVADLPVLVRLDPARIDFSLVQSAGQDLRFVDPDGTPLPYDIEQWNTSFSFVWVRVPLIDSTALDHIWLYYGNPTAAPGANAPAVWASNALVWHLADTLAGAAPQIDDSSNNNNDGTTAGGLSVVSQNSGKIGGSIGFDGVDDWITAPNSPSLAIATDVTIQMWIYVLQQREQWLCDFVVPTSESEINNHLYEVLIDSGDRLEMEWEYGAGMDDPAIDSTVPLVNNLNAWTLVTFVRDSAAKQVRFYENGAPLGTLVAYTNDATGGGASTFWLGGEDDASSSKLPLNGRIDELRITNVVRSPAHIALDYRSMTDTLITYGAPEPF